MRVYVKEEELVKTLSEYLDQIALSEEQIASVIKYLKEIHESENQFHEESLTTLQKERDRIQKRLSLNLVFQNLKLEDKKMLTEIRKPFSNT